MSYRVIFLANPVKLSVKNEQLVIDNGEITKVPISEIRSKKRIPRCLNSCRFSEKLHLLLKKS